MHDLQNPKPYSSEEEKLLDEIREIRQKFDALILKTRLISKNSAQVVHNLYFLHAWMTWTSSTEMMELRKDHDKLEEMPWEMDPYGIPPMFQDIADAIEKSAELKAQRKKK